MSVLAAASLGASAAAAQTLPIPGPYGNAEGCAYLKHGVMDSDLPFVLRPDGLESYASTCEFVQVMPARNGANVVTALCQGEEGAYDVGAFVISEPDPEGDSLLVFRSGEVWHEVWPCS